jgi:hypothetical protein
MCLKGKKTGVGLLPSDSTWVGSCTYGFGPPDRSQTTGMAILDGPWVNSATQGTATRESEDDSRRQWDCIYAGEPRRVPASPRTGRNIVQALARLELGRPPRVACVQATWRRFRKPDRIEEMTNHNDSYASEPQTRSGFTVYPLPSARGQEPPGVVARTRPSRSIPPIPPSLQGYVCDKRSPSSKPGS